MDYDNIVNKMSLEELNLLSRSIGRRREQIIRDKLQRGEMSRPPKDVMDLHWQGSRIEAIKSYRTQMHQKGSPISLMEAKLVIDAIARLDLDRLTSGPE